MGIAFASMVISLFICFLRAFLGWLSTVKSVISQYAPDVALRAEHRRKSRPSAASVHGDIRSPAARHLTVKVPNSHSSHTQFGPGPSPAAPLTVLVRVQRPY